MGVKVRQKPGSDKYWIFINHKGVRRSKCIGAKKEAQAVARQLQAKLALHELNALDEPARTPLFADYVTGWMTSTLRHAYKASSIRAITSMIVHHILPTFGNRRLDAITRQHVREFVATKAQTVSLNYARSIYKTLHTILQQAVDDQVLTVNPASRMGKLLSEKSTGRKVDAQDPFTSGELHRYLEAARAHYPEHTVFSLLLGRTGMRLGEALGLHWDDIQLGASEHDPHRFIRVERTYDAAHRVMTPPKNGKMRMVDLSRELRQALMDLQGTRLDDAILHGRTEPDALVFPGKVGRPLHPSWVYTLHRRICGLAGLRATRVHDLRPSFATIRLYELHSPIQYVSEQLGHSSIGITLNTYGHPRPGTNVSLADRLDGITRQTALYVQPGLSE
jgi:integrase